MYKINNKVVHDLFRRYIMKISLTAIICTLICLHISAKGVAQRVTMKSSKISLKNAFREINKQTGYNFLWSSQKIDSDIKVAVNIQNQPLEVAVSSIIKGLKLRYEIDDRLIIIKEKKLDEDLASSIVLDPNILNKEIVQTFIQVHGRVVDEQGKPIVGITVQVKDEKSQGTTTNNSGDFLLPKVDKNAVLIVSGINIESFEVKVQGKTDLSTLTAKLKVTTLEAAEVQVNTGYQTVSKERVTGSYNVIGSETIERRHSSDLSAALLGTVAGMQGKENADGTINFTIRGAASLYADARPLVVVDGFPVANGFKDINPNDVESVTVLKDAAAASIWGARSANGVIVVSTKKAKQRFNISANVMTRIGEKMNLSTALTTASAADQVAWERLAYENKWFANTYSNSFSELARPYSLAKELLFAHYAKNSISLEEMNSGLNKLSQSDNRKQIKDHLLQNPALQQYNLSISSSNEHMQNMFSIMYEHGVGNVIENNLNRWRMNYTAQAKIFNWLDFNFASNIHYLQSENSGPTINELRMLSPYEMILNDDGSYAAQLMGVNREQYSKIKGTLPYEDWDYNILRESRARSLRSTDINSRFQTGLTFKLLKGLTFDTKFQYEYNISRTRNYYKEDSYYVRDWVNFIVDYDQINKKVNKQFIPKGGILQTTDATSRNYSWRNQLNFNKTIDKHAVAVIAGAEVSQYRMDGTNNPWVWGFDDKTNRMSPLPFGGRSIAGIIQLKNIIGSNLPQLDQSAFGYTDLAVGAPKSRQRIDYNTDAASFSYRNDRYVSVFGNASYTYDNKYSISGSARSDASNLITNDPKYRWAPLWSVGGLWHVSREDFMKPAADWLSRLSLRLTYGFNGNVEKSTSPLTLINMSQIPSSNTGTYTGTFIQGNPLLRWERTGTTNAGIDFGLFGNLLYGSIDVYSKKGVDILGDVPQPTINGGLATQRINQAHISNKGFEIELGVKTKPNESGIWLNTKVTYSYNRNKVTALNNSSIQSQTVASGTTFTEGYPIGSIWSYVYAGMKDGEPQISRTGDQTTYPMASNAMAIANYDDGYLVYSGAGISPHTAGLQATLSGYGFDFSFLVVGNFGGKFRNPTFTYPLLTLGKDIIPMFVKDVLNGSADIPSWPEPNSSTFSSWATYTPYLSSLVESSSFIKLKELNLEYRLPKSFTDRIKMGNIKIFTQVRDLGCIWKSNSRKYDPEWLPGTLAPATTYAFGFNVNF